MRAVKRAHWRALIHGIRLGRLAYSTRGHLSGVDLSHLKGQNPWLRHRNVVGVCVAHKLERGRLGPLCLQVLVRTKHAEHKVPSERMVPKWIDPRPVLAFRRLPTDVRAVGAFSPDTLVSGARPTQPGFAVGGKHGGIGTIGCAVRDATGHLLGLSCAHVIADDGKAAPGALVLVPARDQADALGVADPEFGQLVGTGSIGFGPADAASNLDAATFLPDDLAWLEREVAVWQHAPSGIASNVKAHDEVFKVGAATERTFGAVVTPLASITVPYVVGSSIKSAVFLDQIGISPFTDEGDSGSLVLTKDGRAVGLHFASAQGMSICTPIQTVLAGLGVSLA